MRAWLLVCIAIVLAILWAVFDHLHPPDRFVMAAGPENGAYAQIAGKYQTVLARDRIQLDIVYTAGSAENARLIAEGKVDAALLQGGITVPSATVEAVGTIFYEPIVFLIRRDAPIPRNPANWSGLRIASGMPGSGTEAAFRDFEAAVGLRHEANTHVPMPYAKAADAVERDEIDIATFVAPVDAPYLIEAYGHLSLGVLPLEHVEAISRRMEYAGVVTVPAGGMSLAPVLPPVERSLIALEARLAVQVGLHPALVNRLTMAAIELHGRRGIITDPGRFPSIEGAGLVVNNTARQLILEGPSTWHDWLPYWVAAQINRVLLLVLPFFFVVVPLLRLIPALYAYLMRWRVWRYYPEIRRVEEELASNPSSDALADMQARLAEVEDRLAAMRLPTAYRQSQYDARLHLELVQNRLSEIRQARMQKEGSSNAP
ncbi:TAXI family TRAP transporter solute-binding subunit [Ruegeria aquimaris]|uniref:ABC transporter substrate-binding protein n=1 Tax=Ruegeria aquimaris TaxID=2984333 RepID=A0ABT3AQW6_9RHOB|nr:TAXI family TRAP transporter solute-binding subunit [Ruegeria sp. XHP0148]MCV2891073.1 ABC transporter substrate-binding protein [Ruegeria sp. XHP0148]